MKPPSPGSPSPSFALSPSSPDLDALAEALTSSRPHADILKDFNLTRSQLASLLDTQELATRIESLERLQALEHKTRIAAKLRAAHETALDKLLEHESSDNAAESRKAAQTLLRQTTAYLIALSRPAATRRPNSSSAGSPTVREGQGPAPEPSLPADASRASPSFAPSPVAPSPSPAVALSHHRTVALPPQPPKPYTTPELLFAHQINQLRTHQPKNCNEAFNALYDYIDHPIKCITSLQPRLKSRIDFSSILNHYNADYEDLGPATMDQEVVTPAPISPDLSLKPVLKYFAIKRYAFKREGQTPLYLRVHFAKQEPLRGETTDRWGLSDLAIDSP